MSWCIRELLVFREFISKRADLFCTPYISGVSVLCWQHNNKPLSIYRNIKVKTVSTPNRNLCGHIHARREVVLYRFSTSNHNIQVKEINPVLVVLYRFSTSNHNLFQFFTPLVALYYIVSLHQTTTK